MFEFIHFPVKGRMTPIGFGDVVPPRYFEQGKRQFMLSFTDISDFYAFVLGRDDAGKWSLKKIDPDMPDFNEEEIGQLGALIDQAVWRLEAESKIEIPNWV